MQKNKKTPFIDTAVQLLRRLLIFAVIIAVASLAVFWESLPASIKNTITSLAADHSDNDENVLVPHKFRIEDDSKNSENFLLQPPHSTQLADLPDETERHPSEEKEYRTTNTDSHGLDDDTLVWVQEELKQLGATACQLTYWGDSRNMFRFSCQVPVNERNPIAVRTFQSIGPDIARTMQEVIDQVRQWQATRR